MAICLACTVFVTLFGYLLVLSALWAVVKDHLFENKLHRERISRLRRIYTPLDRYKLAHEQEASAEEIAELRGKLFQVFEDVVEEDKSRA